MADNETETLLQQFEQLRLLPIDDAEYDKEFPLRGPHVASTCSKCRRGYNQDEFSALCISNGEAGTWHYASSNTEFAVRVCKCGNRLARRVR